jgi:CheY-like chemotaxis protein
VGQRILMVDDETRILDALRRTLRGSYDLTTAASGAEALSAQRKALGENDPFAVIVSDMMMPGMNGAEFLTEARKADPDAVRIILSGQADLQSTIAAVNQADLYRFLTKPVEPGELTRALDDGLRQYRLVTAEKELLEGTLQGAVNVLTELLSMSAPEAFSRTARVKTLVEAGAVAAGVSDDWRLGIAASLSQIGCIALPDLVLRQVELGADLSPAELAMYQAHPRVARGLLERIPRLDDVAKWVGRQPTTPGGPPAKDAELAEIVFAAATSYLCAYESTGTPGKAAHTLFLGGGNYPTPVVDALQRAAASLTATGTIREVTAKQVRPGMVLEQDVVTVTGMVLVRKGERINDTLALRLHNFADSVGVVEPITVIEGVDMEIP